MDDETLTREMATTAQEFRRVLDFAFPDAVSERDERLCVAAAGAKMEITLAPLPPRVIAKLSLPRLMVRIRFTAGSFEACQALLARMDRAMQRGGG
ncbi:hypothetical protein [Sulfuricystis multivorans]|uniref:hypothetical protein n=1 Tax=Sulfuricystis multivorans TaxID=2211108 RepID=UPI000F81CF03|nr:hypothetical protein [Sulfuricystis multivorans]